MSAINNPETLLRARQQIGHISNADDSARAHSWHVQAVGWFNALHAERLIDQATHDLFLAEASKAREARRVGA